MQQNPGQGLRGWNSRAFSALREEMRNYFRSEPAPKAAWPVQKRQAVTKFETRQVAL
jgi:hypothetical protein